MRIAIEGMHCQACVARVRKALEKVDGVSVSRVDVGSAEIEADAAHASAALDAVKRAGYDARVAA